MIIIAFKVNGYTLIEYRKRHIRCMFILSGYGLTGQYLKDSQELLYLRGESMTDTEAEP